MILFLAVFIMPLSAMAMKSLNETDLSDISCQAGVSMFVDITMNIRMGTIAWGDSDGLGAGPDNPWGMHTSGGYVGINGLSIENLTIRSYPSSTAPNSVSFWPDELSVNIYNGVPYYRVNVGR